MASARTGPRVHERHEARRKLDPSGPAPGAVTGIRVTPNDNGELIAVVTLIALLTILLVVVAGLGVLNIVVLQLRERVHDLGVFKSVGMTPRQAIAMVVCSVTLIGLLAGSHPLGVLGTRSSGVAETARRCLRCTDTGVAVVPVGMPATPCATASMHRSRHLRADSQVTCR